MTSNKKIETTDLNDNIITGTPDLSSRNRNIMKYEQDQMTSLSANDNNINTEKQKLSDNYNKSTIKSSKLSSPILQSNKISAHEEKTVQIINTENNKNNNDRKKQLNNYLHRLNQLNDNSNNNLITSTSSDSETSSSTSPSDYSLAQRRQESTSEKIDKNNKSLIKKSVFEGRESFIITDGWVEPVFHIINPYDYHDEHVDNDNITNSATINCSNDEQQIQSNHSKAYKTKNKIADDNGNKQRSLSMSSLRSKSKTSKIKKKHKKIQQIDNGAFSSWKSNWFTD